MDQRNSDRSYIEQSVLPTRKQIEREISQKFCSWYRQKVGGSPQKVSSTIFGTYLVIVAENATTTLESVMQKQGATEIVSAIRPSINKALKQGLKEIVEHVALVQVSEMICELNFDSNRLIATVIMEKQPVVKNKRVKRNY